MELKTVSADELRLLAESFRSRAEEHEENCYRELILRTACELEEHAALLEAHGGTALMIPDGDLVEAGLVH